jgi:hypothetical protein
MTMTRKKKNTAEPMDPGAIAYLLKSRRPGRSGDYVEVEQDLNQEPGKPDYVDALEAKGRELLAEERRKKKPRGKKDNGERKAI